MHKTNKTVPYLFSRPAVNCENYKKMLRYYAMRKVLDLSESTMFQQDGAPS